jgi:predicted ABC-type sugar transport system permease subunit
MSRSGFELQAIAAVIGGTSLMGGRSPAVRTLFGVLITAVSNSSLAPVVAKDEIKRLVTGSSNTDMIAKVPLLLRLLILRKTTNSATGFVP